MDSQYYRELDIAEASYADGYETGNEVGFDKGLTAGQLSKSEEADRKVKEAIELIDLFYKTFPSVKDYSVALTETQKLIADKLVRIVNIATLTERQRCLDIVDDAFTVGVSDYIDECLNDVEQRIKGN